MIESPTPEHPLPLVFIAVGPNVWGRGLSVSAALAQLAKAAGKRVLPASMPYIVLLLPDGAYDAWVDDYGGINWYGVNAPAVKVDERTLAQCKVKRARPRSEPRIAAR